MPHTRSIETTLATWSLVGGLAANFAGLLLIGKLPWPLSVALVFSVRVASSVPCFSSQRPIGSTRCSRLRVRTDPSSAATATPLLPRAISRHYI